MNKNKILKTIFALVICFISTGMLSQHAEAAKWHKGTPKVIRGTFQAKRTNPAQGFGFFYTIKSKSIDLNQSNYPRDLTIKLKYKRLKKNIYLVKGHTKKCGFILGGPYSNVFYRKGKKLLTTDYSYYKKHGKKAFKWSAKNPAIKTKHVKNGGKIIHM